MSPLGGGRLQRVSDSGIINRGLVEELGEEDTFIFISETSQVFPHLTLSVPKTKSRLQIGMSVNDGDKSSHNSYKLIYSHRCFIRSIGSCYLML